MKTDRFSFRLEVFKKVKIYYFIFILLLTLLLGCSSQNRISYNVIFNDEGLGAIKALAPFSTTQIQALMPGFEVKAFSRFESGRTHTVIRLQRGSEVLCDCYPDASGKYIETIESLSKHVRTSKGYRINTLFETSSCSEKNNNICALEPHLYAELNETRHIVRFIWSQKGY